VLSTNVGSHWARALFGLGQTNAAEAKIDEFLKENPEDRPGELTAMKAMLLAAKGEELEAVAKLREAIARKQTIGFGEFHHTAYFIACAYGRLRRNEQALHWLKEAAETGFPCRSFARLPGASQNHHRPGAGQAPKNRFNGARNPHGENIRSYRIFCKAELVTNQTVG